MICPIRSQLQKGKRQGDLSFCFDIHYSDFWADPGKQSKPAAWKNLNFDQLTAAVRDYTSKVVGH